LFWVAEIASWAPAFRHQAEEEAAGSDGLLYAILKRRKMAMTAAALKAIALGGLMFIMVGIERERVLRPMWRVGCTEEGSRKISRS